MPSGVQAGWAEEKSYVCHGESSAGVLPACSKLGKGLPNAIPEPFFVFKHCIYGDHVSGLKYNLGPKLGGIIIYTFLTPVGLVFLNIACTQLCCAAYISVGLVSAAVLIILSQPPVGQYAQHCDALFGL